MKTATVADLRNNFSRFSRWIASGEPVRITKRGRPFALLAPSEENETIPPWPDLHARLVPGDGRVTSEVVSEARGEW